MKNLILTICTIIVAICPLSARAIEGEYYLTLQLATMNNHNEFVCVLGALEIAEQVAIKKLSNGKYRVQFSDGSRGTARKKSRTRWSIVKKLSYAGTSIKSRFSLNQLIAKTDLYSAHLKEITTESGTKACTTEMSGYGFRLQ